MLAIPYDMVNHRMQVSCGNMRMRQIGFKINPHDGINGDLQRGGSHLQLHRVPLILKSVQAISPITSVS